MARLLPAVVSTQSSLGFAHHRVHWFSKSFSIYEQPSGFDGDCCAIFVAALSGFDISHFIFNGFHEQHYQRTLNIFSFSEPFFPAHLADPKMANFAAEIH
jgi:hypothetical protein